MSVTDKSRMCLLQTVQSGFVRWRPWNISVVNRCTLNVLVAGSEMGQSQRVEWA